MHCDVRELGAVLGALVIAGRSGSAMGAELGTMRVTEQIDALEVLATDPVHYLVVPRVWATTIMLPLLVALGDAVGIVGGYLVSVVLLGANPVSTSTNLLFMDAATSLGPQGAVFVFLIALSAAAGLYPGAPESFAQPPARGLGEMGCDLDFFLQVVFYERAKRCIVGGWGVGPSAR